MSKLMTSDVQTRVLRVLQLHGWSVPGTITPPAPPASATVFPHRLKESTFNLHNKNCPGASAITSERGKLAYVPIPKNACSSIKIFFYELIHGKEYSDHFSKIHRQFDYTAIDFEKFAADEEYFKFLVVRDPIDRFVSAYNNRVKLYQELTRHWFKAHDQHPQKTLAFFESNSLAYDPDINQFARRIQDYIKVSSNIIHHFFPQHFFFHGRPEAFTKIYNIRQLPKLAAHLEERIGAPVHFQSVQETKNLENAARRSDLGYEELDELKKFYAEDYRILEPYL